MTGFEDDWNKFFALRTAKGAHPDAQAIAKSLMTTILAEQCGTGLNDSTRQNNYDSDNPDQRTYGKWS